MEYEYKIRRLAIPYDDPVFKTDDAQVDADQVVDSRIAVKLNEWAQDGWKLFRFDKYGSPRGLEVFTVWQRVRPEPVQALYDYRSSVLPVDQKKMQERGDD